MDNIRRVQDFENIKILADPRRLAILRLLMAEAATLSQLGQVLGEHPAKIRHHLKQLETAGLIELVETREVRGFVEKYYRARARAFVLQELILPADAEQNTIVIVGSHDLALEALARYLNEQHDANDSAPKLLVLPTGSLEGLISLRQGAGHLAGSHLLDADTGEYNLPFVRHIFPDRQTTLITLVNREQGLILEAGNPHEIRGLEDLVNKNLLLVNRNRGSGTRLWLDRQIAQLKIAPSSIRGYGRELRTHTAVADAISQGRANAGIGLQAAAIQHDLDFIPLFQERFDLVIPQDMLQKPAMQPLLDFVQSAKFRHLAASLSGYSTANSGSQLFP
jgi:putative molybdopterin biosynthesis protein